MMKARASVAPATKDRTITTQQAIKAARTMTVAKGPLPHVMASWMKGVTLVQICACAGPAGISAADTAAMPTAAVAVFVRIRIFCIGRPLSWGRAATGAAACLNDTEKQ